MGFLFAASSGQGIVAESDALPGRENPVLEHPEPHLILGTPIDGAWKDGQRSLVLGLGCFWGAEKLFWQLDGVESTAVGYAGGYTPNPTYREVCSNLTGHAEVVRVIYNPSVISFDQLVRYFFEAHDPTQGYRQGNDIGSQYRSVIYCNNDMEKETSRRIACSYAGRLFDNGYGAVTTELKKLSDTPRGQMYLAEAEHQQYLAKNPNGYCPVHATGVRCA